MDQSSGPERTAGLRGVWNGRACNRLRLSVLSVLIGASGLVGLAQDAPPTDKLFTDRVRVDVVEVEVFVTDRQGRPVYGLERGDFESWSTAGRSRSATSDRLRRPLIGLMTERPAPVARRRARPAALPGRFRRPDEPPAGPAGPAIMASLRAFLLDQRSAQGDRVLVAAYDSRVEVLSGFDDDDAALDRAMEAVDFDGSFRTSESQAEFNRILRCLEVTCQNPEFIWDEVRIYARFLRHRNRIMLAHLGSFIDSHGRSSRTPFGPPGQ